jgi:3-hydroxybutyryl-CoA dehydrogenase
MAIKKIGVLGAGVMGTGIAHVTAMSGIDVVLRDIDEAFTAGSIKRMEQLMNRSIDKGKLTEEQKAKTLSHILTTTDIAPLADADLVIEAVVENLELKKQVFAELDKVCKPETIFATNTSSMSITEIASGSGRPENFCGLHFFNPVQVMKLVEVISGELTGSSVVEDMKNFAERIGKTAVHVRKDSPGFIVNRLLVPYLNEAVRLMDEGVASPEDIDKAVELGLNYPLGPFKMLDMGGIDLTVTVLDYFKEEFNDSGYAPRMTLKQMLRAGKQGRKSGEGFYKYENK